MVSSFRSIILLSLLIYSLLINSIKAEECDFSALFQEIPLFSEAFDGTEKIRPDSSSWAIFKKSLPNLEKIFAYQNPRIIVLAGWSHSIDDFSKFTLDQINAYFEDFAHKGALLDAGNRGGTGEYKFLKDAPLTAKVNIEYIDGGHTYKDIAVDIIATRYCIFSVKISARQDDFTAQQWNAFEEQMEFVRQFILSRYGTFDLPETGSRIWWSSLIAVATELSILVIIAFILSILYIKFVPFQPGPATRRYSGLIMFLMVFVTLGLLAEAELIQGVSYYRYGLLINYFSIFFTHLIAYKTNRKRIVAFAIWLVAVGQLYTILTWLFKWQSFSFAQVTGVIIGLTIVMITLGASYKKSCNNNIPSNSTV
jgi:hypothetical protein